jgi:hypothetical protein
MSQFSIRFLVSKKLLLPCKFFEKQYQWFIRPHTQSIRFLVLIEPWLIDEAGNPGTNHRSQGLQRLRPGKNQDAENFARRR